MVVGEDVRLETDHGQRTKSAASVRQRHAEQDRASPFATGRQVRLSADWSAVSPADCAGAPGRGQAASEGLARAHRHDQRSTRRGHLDHLSVGIHERHERLVGAAQLERGVEHSLQARAEVLRAADGERRPRARREARSPVWTRYRRGCRVPCASRDRDGFPFPRREECTAINRLPGPPAALTLAAPPWKTSGNHPCHARRRAVITERPRPGTALPFDVEELDASTATSSTPSCLPPQCYTSPEFYAFEMEAIFAREWVCVGRQEQIPNPGDFFSITLMDDPLLVVRGLDGEVKAMSAVCRHRGAIVAEGAGNCEKAFICPYHSWSYDLDGNLLGAPEIDQDARLQSSRRAATAPGGDVARVHLRQLRPGRRAARPAAGRGRRHDRQLPRRRARLPTASFLRPALELEGHDRECDGVLPLLLLHRGYHECAPTRNLVEPPLKHVEQILVMRARTTHPDAAFNPTERVMFPVIPSLSEFDRNHFTWICVLPNLIMSCNADNPPPADAPARDRRR